MRKLPLILLIAAFLAPSAFSPVLAADEPDRREDQRQPEVRREPEHQGDQRKLEPRREPEHQKDQRKPEVRREPIHQVNQRQPEVRREPEQRSWHGDIHHFREYDFDYWRTGHWTRTFHEGRNGWWWVAGGAWYFYPAPIYPYPNPYTPPEIVTEVVPNAPTVYYYCSNPAG